jgi:hypothetical protein
MSVSLTYGPNFVWPPQILTAVPGHRWEVEVYLQPIRISALEEVGDNATPGQFYSRV